MFVRDASADTPNLFNFRFVTVTALLVPLLKTNFANGASPCPSTTVPAAAVSEANDTMNIPVVTGGGGGVPGVGVGVGEGAAPTIVFNFARVDAPTNPVPADNPTGAKISAAYLFWNFTTAALVRLPKYTVSLPAEPTPEAATCVSADWFRIDCKHLTSVPELPTAKFLVKDIPAQAPVPALGVPPTCAN